MSLRELGEEYGYQKFKCPACGHVDWTDSSVVECGLCGWTADESEDEDEVEV